MWDKTLKYGVLKPERQSILWGFYLCLDHVAAIVAHFEHDSKYVDHAAAANVLKQAIDQNESPRTTNTSACYKKRYKMSLKIWS